MVNCLIVDDSRTVRRLCAGMIRPLQFDVREAESGEIALALCKEAMPDLMLLDWNMPGLSGLDVIQELRLMEGGMHPKVIFCTSEGDSSRILEALEKGADEYIMKPFGTDILESKLAMVGLL